MKQRSTLLLPLLIVTLIALTIGAIAVATRGPDAPEASGWEVAELLGNAENTEGFARATEVRPFRFPEDHGPHPEFKTEWWYFTGNLFTEQGRRFGYQLTFFRAAHAPPEPAHADGPAEEAEQARSAWSTSQLYMAHFAVTDVQGKAFHSFERFARGALGLAGAKAEPFRVWLEDWQAASSGDGFLPLRLYAAEKGVSIDLVLSTGKPLVLQGERGLSRKGPEPGNASYYYSFTRLPSRGTVVIDGNRFEVEGQSWMDREWSTSVLGKDVEGWDWFSLQLSDGRELMLYQLRNKQGAATAHSAGTLVNQDGSTVSLGADDFRLKPLETWRSDAGAQYPVRWRIEVPAHDLTLEVNPALAGQEHTTSVRYWEGAVQAEGTAKDASVTATGYLEMTGYGEREPISPRG